MADRRAFMVGLPTRARAATSAAGPRDGNVARGYGLTARYPCISWCRAEQKFVQ